MIRARRIAGAAALFVAAGVGSAEPAAILLARHAEKATESNEKSVALSDAGQARARRLADLLAEAGVTSVLATDTVRARETAGPLAKKLSLEVENYEVPRVEGKPNAEAFAADLRGRSGVVLVIGHSNTVPAILTALGHTDPVTIGDREYDDLFVVLPRGNAAPTVLRLTY